MSEIDDDDVFYLNPAPLKLSECSIDYAHDQMSLDYEEFAARDDVAIVIDNGKS